MPWWKTHGFTGHTVANGEVSFTVERDEADNDKTGTVWVSNTYAGTAWNGLTPDHIDRAVRWGTWDSLTGEAGPFPVNGDMLNVAMLTTTPWKFRHNDPELAF